MKHNIFTFIFLAIFNCILTSEDSMSKKGRHMYKRGSVKGIKPKNRPVNLDIPDAQVYFQAWVKYYHYPNDTHFNRPPSLFQNNAYFKQRIPKNKAEEKDASGSIYIPNKASFFMVVYNETVSFFAQRENQVNHLIDSLKIANIRVIPEDDVLEGGVKDDKNFPFGFCIELVADIPTHYTETKRQGDGTPETWIVCTSQGKEKDVLLSTLIKLKVKQQRLMNNGLKILNADTKVIGKPKPGIGSLIAKPVTKMEARSGLLTQVNPSFIR